MGQGIIVNEPSVVAMEESRNQLEVHAVGQEAKEMIGRTPRSLHVIHPMQRGVIADFSAAQRMLKCFIARKIPRRRPCGSRVVISVPAMATSVEARAFKEPGRSVTSGLPKTVEVKTNELCDPISNVVSSIIDLVRRVLEQTPPELSADIYDNGLVLSGGGSLLRSLDRVLVESIRVPVRLATQPLTAVAFGAAEMMRQSLN